ncbi:MAG: ROK family protein [Bacteroides sp.]
MEKVIGIDLGGTSIKYALVDEAGESLYGGTLPSGASESAEKIIEQLEKAIQAVLDFSQSKGYSIKGIGIGSPGIIDTATGTVLGGAENLEGWEQVPLVEILSDSFRLPVYLDNDANVMGLAETTFGAAKGCTDVVFLTIGTGIGGGLIIDGKLYGGYRNRGGELGHFPLIANGETCACGSRGCFEHYASATALIRRYTALLNQSGKALPEEINGKYIVDQYKQGEKEALTALDENCDLIGHAVAGFINIFSPQKVIIGGGLSDAGSFYIDKIKESASRYSMPDCAVNTTIEAAILGNRAGCLGAAGLVFNA